MRGARTFGQANPLKKRRTMLPNINWRCVDSLQL
jgi:hypothetical protein